MRLENLISNTLQVTLMVSEAGVLLDETKALPVLSDFASLTSAWTLSAWTLFGNCLHRHWPGKL